MKRSIPSSTTVFIIIYINKNQLNLNLNQVKVATRSSEKNIVKFGYHMIDSFNLGKI